MFLSLGKEHRRQWIAVEGELAEAVGLLQVIFRCRPVGSSKKVCVLLLNTWNVETNCMEGFNV